MSTIQKHSGRQQRYFAFVESIDELPPEFNQDEVATPSFLAFLSSRRRELRLGPPTHAVWLDCVEQEYFLELPWLTEECDRNNLQHSLRRRQRLQALDPDRSVALFTLLRRNDPEEKLAREGFLGSLWHAVTLSDVSGIPADVGENFDAVANGELSRWRFFQYNERCEGERLALLLRAFTLDFIPDADFDSRNLAPPIPISTPPNRPSRVNAARNVFADVYDLKILWRDEDGDQEYEVGA
jgi:hypothetical protein